MHWFPAAHTNPAPRRLRKILGYDVDAQKSAPSLIFPRCQGKKRIVNWRLIARFWLLVFQLKPAPFPSVNERRNHGG